MLLAVLRRDAIGCLNENAVLVCKTSGIGCQDNAVDL